jgi:methylated-DNA-[protein]-cysteine S-methyltransferase
MTEGWLFPWSEDVIGPLGHLVVEGRNGVQAVRWVPGPIDAASLDAAGRDFDDPLGAADALSRYFAGELDALDSVPLELSGTPYQHRVWEAVRAIPPGDTRSYGDLAVALKSVPRAVGRANATNPAPLFVPCHRVVGGDGDLTGYAWGLDRKRWLLEHESRELPLFP